MSGEIWIVEHRFSDGVDFTAYVSYEAAQFAAGSLTGSSSSGEVLELRDHLARWASATVLDAETGLSHLVETWPRGQLCGTTHCGAYYVWPSASVMTLSRLRVFRAVLSQETPATCLECAGKASRA